MRVPGNRVLHSGRLPLPARRAMTEKSRRPLIGRRRQNCPAPIFALPTTSMPGQYNMRPVAIRCWRVKPVIRSKADACRSVWPSCNAASTATASGQSISRHRTRAARPVTCRFLRQLAWYGKTSAAFRSLNRTGSPALPLAFTANWRAAPATKCRRRARPVTLGSSAFNAT